VNLVHGRAEATRLQRHGQVVDGHGVPCPYKIAECGWRDQRVRVARLDRANGFDCEGGAEAPHSISWGEGQGFVSGDDPDADDAGFLALFFLGGVVGVGHGVEGAEGYGDFNGVGTDGGTFAKDFVALDGAEVAFFAPVGDEVFHAVTGFGLPEFVGFLGVAGDHGIEEMGDSALFGVVAEAKPEDDSDD
jgi:hypothetical protein